MVGEAGERRVARGSLRVARAESKRAVHRLAMLRTLVGAACEIHADEGVVPRAARLRRARDGRAP